MTRRAEAEIERLEREKAEIAEAARREIENLRAQNLNNAPKPADNEVLLSMRSSYEYQLMTATEESRAKIERLEAELAAAETNAKARVHASSEESDRVAKENERLRKKLRESQLKALDLRKKRNVSLGASQQLHHLETL